MLSEISQRKTSKGILRLIGGIKKSKEMNQPTKTETDTQTEETWGGYQRGEGLWDAQNR